LRWWCWGIVSIFIDPAVHWFDWYDFRRKWEIFEVIGRFEIELSAE
jgi:hypothetical protein